MTSDPSNTPPPPPRPQLNFAALLRLRPERALLISAARAAIASGICLCVGWGLGNQEAGLTANLGAFAALYGGGRPYRNRARLLAMVVAGLVLSVVAGVAAGAVPNPWVGIAVAALVATVASFFCAALTVGPPGAYIFMLACAVSALMYGQASHLLQIAMLVAAGGAVAWTLHMLEALWQPRGPERLAVAGAAAAVADYIESTARGHSDLPRHRAATSLHDAWRALIVWQQPGDRSTTLAQLQACSRELHGLFAVAVRESSAGRIVDPELSVRARSVQSRIAQLPGEPPLGEFNERRAFFRSRESIWSSFAWSTQPSRIALRVGAAALIAGSVGTLIGLDHVYWATAAAMLILYQGFNWVLAMQRGIERTLGTLLGLISATVLAWMHPRGLMLVGCIVALQFTGQLFVRSNYAFAVFFFTPMALLMATAGSVSASEASRLILARGFDTVIGCAVGLIVLLATYRTGGATAKSAFAETLTAAKSVLPFLSRGDATSVEARMARRRLRSSAFDLIQIYEEQAGGTGRAREDADRAWPAVVAAQRLAYRILAACWEIEAAGEAERAGAAPFDADGEQAIGRALDSFLSGQAAKIGGEASDFLVPELMALNESLPDLHK